MTDSKRRQQGNCDLIYSAQVNSISSGLARTSEPRDVATLQCSQFLHWNRKTCKEISDLVFITIRLSLGSRFEQRVRARPIAKYLAHDQAGFRFLHGRGGPGLKEHG